MQKKRARTRTKCWDIHFLYLIFCLSALFLLNLVWEQLSCQVFPSFFILARVLKMHILLVFDLYVYILILLIVSFLEVCGDVS